MNLKLVKIYFDDNVNNIFKSDQKRIIYNQDRCFSIIEFFIKNIIEKKRLFLNSTFEKILYNCLLKGLNSSDLKLSDENIEIISMDLCIYLHKICKEKEMDEKCKMKSLKKSIIRRTSIDLQKKSKNLSISLNSYRKYTKQIINNLEKTSIETNDLHTNLCEIVSNLEDIQKKLRLLIDHDLANHELQTFVQFDETVKVVLI